MLRRKRELHKFIVINAFTGDMLSDALVKLLNAMNRSPKSCLQPRLRERYSTSAHVDPKAWLYLYESLSA